MTPAEIEAYVGTDFENYYSEFPHGEFGTLVWVNNARVAALCIALGVLGLPVLCLLASQRRQRGRRRRADDQLRPRRRCSSA